MIYSYDSVDEPSLQRQAKTICNNDIKTRDLSLNRILIITVDNYLNK